MKIGSTLCRFFIAVFSGMITGLGHSRHDRTISIFGWAIVILNVLSGIFQE